jgi:hypothetical protein
MKWAIDDLHIMALFLMSPIFVVFLTPPPAPDPGRADYNSFVSFSDPDGNGWPIQEVRQCAPGC